MIKSKTIFGSLLAVFIFTSLMSIYLPYAEAHPHSGTIQTEDHSHQPISEIIPLNGEIGIEKTVLQFHASEENTLPWLQEILALLTFKLFLHN